ncbi:DUF6875 domain-containing protein [Nocardia sp. alder85J]|uniref:DUF6875 domain-containing protein n=1 Tax=Nocardia sp. alder85J TaxID=2862949 RepID=UPI001CD49C45|nr:hypothetical protein [Nocardia sp. alder85J]MCX4092260.1 hypothetical protein [Nocardia sp. alder85J]
MTTMASPAARVGPGSGTCWWNVYDDLERWDRLDPAAGRLTRWVDDHLVRPHPELGRDGAVCPFVRYSSTRRLFWAGMVPGGDTLTVPEIDAVVDEAIGIYRGLRGEHPSDVRSLTLITMFPGLTRTDRIDEVHRARKPEVVAKGWMLGQFYPGCAVPGLWNHEFHPLDAPVPMLVLRKMMSTDFPFLVGRTDWLYSYFTALAPDLPKKLRWAVAKRLRIEGPAVEDITSLRVHLPEEHAR